MNKARTVLAAAAITAAIGCGTLLATPAMADTAEIVGDVSVTFDFTTAGEVGVVIDSTNLSTVPAYGTAAVAGPDGEVYTWGSRLYQAGEKWTFQKITFDYTCDDLDEISAIAYGSATRAGAPEWTSGKVAYPDERLTVIGCDLPAPAINTVAASGVSGVSASSAVAARSTRLSDTGGTIAWWAFGGASALLLVGGAILAIRRRFRSI